MTTVIKMFATAALLAVLIMPASAYRLKLSANQDIGCKMLNKVMSDFMGDEDFLDCNDQQSDHIHMQSVNQCMRYISMEWMVNHGLNWRNLPPLRPYRNVQQGCAMLVLNISQDEYDA